MRFLERPESRIAPQFVNTGDMPAETVNTGIFESLFIQSPLSIQGEANFIFSGIDLDDEEVTGGRLHDFTAAFNWYATRNYRVLTNVIRAHRSDAEPVWIFQLRLQVAF